MPPGKTTFVSVPVPFVRVSRSNPSDAPGPPAAGLGVATNATWPEGVPLAPCPAATMLLTLTGVPCVIPLIEVAACPLTVALKVVIDGREVTDDQFFTRFATFTDPSPVARS